MNKRKEEDTKLFYKELENKKCNVELLYDLSKDGIFLYIPLFNYENTLKYHEYAVSISLKYKQYCMIFSHEQFENFYLYFIKK